MKTKIRKELKTMEYPDAPSGSVRLYNYKEPFMKFEQGYGFQGVLLFDSEMDRVQCHLCGKWYHALNSMHLGKEHNMKAWEYKDLVGLSRTTALIGENMREKLIASGLDKRLINLRQNSKQEYKMSQETKEKIRVTLKKNVRELQNLRGTCPEQLIHRLKQKTIELGRTPGRRDYGEGFFETIRKQFGSMEQACLLAGIQYRKPGQTTTHLAKYSNEVITDWIKEYFLANDRLPLIKEFPEKMRWSIQRRKVKFEDLKKKVLLEENKYVKDPDLRYSKEDLIFWLKNFEKVNGRQPSASDGKRGLIPSPSMYHYHFGSWKKALQVAFN